MQRAHDELKRAISEVISELYDIQSILDTYAQDEDTIQVVRCKDCKHLFDKSNPNVLCANMKDDGYCSYGEAYDKVGKWYKIAQDSVMCSLCGFLLCCGEDNKNYFFCPKCGAYMKN